MLIFDSPSCPDSMDWSTFYPAFVEASDAAEGEINLATDDSISRTMDSVKRLKQDVQVADIGCGFGGLLVALAPKLPDTLLLGICAGDFFGPKLIDAIRHGNPNASHRICARTNQSIASSKPRQRSLPKRSMLAGKYHEVPTQFLQETSALEDLPLLPRSAFQSPKTQSSNRFDHPEFGIRIRGSAWGNCIYYHGCGESSQLDGSAL